MQRILAAESVSGGSRKKKWRLMDELTSLLVEATSWLIDGGMRGAVVSNRSLDYIDPAENGRIRRTVVHQKIIQKIRPTLLCNGVDQATHDWARWRRIWWADAIAACWPPGRRWSCGGRVFPVVPVSTDCGHLRRCCDPTDDRSVAAPATRWLPVPDFLQSSSLAKQLTIEVQRQIIGSFIRQLIPAADHHKEMALLAAQLDGRNFGGWTFQRQIWPAVSVGQKIHQNSDCWQRRSPWQRRSHYSADSASCFGRLFFPFDQLETKDWHMQRWRNNRRQQAKQATIDAAQRENVNTRPPVTAQDKNSQPQH